MAHAAGHKPWGSIKCLALGPFCDSYIARFSLLGNPEEPDSVGEFARLKIESRAVPGAEALFGRSRA